MIGVQKPVGYSPTSEVLERSSRPHDCVALNDVNRSAEKSWLGEFKECRTGLAKLVLVTASDAGIWQDIAGKD